MKQVAQVWRNGKLVDVIVEVKWKIITVYEARVNGRIFEETESKERAEWLKEHLPNFYRNAEITVTPKRKRKYTERRYL